MQSIIPKCLLHTFLQLLTPSIFQGPKYLRNIISHHHVAYTRSLQSYPIYLYASNPHLNTSNPHLNASNPRLNIPRLKESNPHLNIIWSSIYHLYQQTHYQHQYIILSVDIRHKEGKHPQHRASATNIHLKPISPYSNTYHVKHIINYNTSYMLTWMKTIANNTNNLPICHGWKYSCKHPLINCTSFIFVSSPTLAK